MRHTLLITALSFLVAAPAGAQQLKVSFDNGLVSVDANAVPVRQILNEWAKQGGTKVVGVERITGAPLTIKLIDVPESRALEVILRSVAGYMAAPRASGTGASMYDRILVMATSAAPAATAAATPATRPTAPDQGMAGTQRFVPPRPQQAEDEDEGRGGSESAESTGVHVPAAAAAGHGAAGPVPEHAGQRRPADDRQPGDRRTEHHD